MNGWIKLHRQILVDDFYRSLTSKQKTVIITLLLLASSTDKRIVSKGEVVEIEAGELITSLVSLQAYCPDCSVGSIRNTLKKAEESGFIKITKSKNYTLIKVKNWGRYQQSETLSVEKHVKDVDKKSVLDKNSEAYRLSYLLFALMKKHNPNVKEPNWNTWASDMDKLIRIDKRQVAQIEAVIRWCQEDSFWYKNILSPQKLRKQYDKLVLQLPKKSTETIKKVDRIGIPDGWLY